MQYRCKSVFSVVRILFAVYHHAACLPVQFVAAKKALGVKRHTIEKCMAAWEKVLHYLRAQKSVDEVKIEVGKELRRAA